MKKHGIHNFNAEQLQNELHTTQATTSVQARWVIIKMHLCHNNAGTVVTCPSRRVEPHDVLHERTTGKACYLNQEHAEAAGAALTQLGLPTLYAYECVRSRTTHWHLTERTQV